MFSRGVYVILALVLLAAAAWAARMPTQANKFQLQSAVTSATFADRWHDWQRRQALGDPTAPKDVRNDPRWTMTLEDEFDGGTLNTSLWNVYNNQTHGPEELELYMKEQVWVNATDNTLVIETIRQDIMYGRIPYNYTSGYLDTQNNFFQQYGRWEVVAKLPYGNSIWPAHWLMPNNHSVCWPVGGEIDIMEYVGADVNGDELPVLGTYHWANDCGEDLYRGGNGKIPPIGSNITVDWFNTYHTFAVEWHEGGIIWFVDNFPYIFWDDSVCNCTITEQPMYIILNTAISWYTPPPSGTTVFPATHTIDSVRVYKQNY